MLPVICSGPSRFTVPAARLETRTLPLKVLQLATEEKSAPELMVIVAVAVPQLLWAATTPRTANAGRRSFWENMVMEI